VKPVVAGSSPVRHPSLASGPAAAFRAVSQAALAQIEANARGFLLSDDPEFLHQLRVGVRRLRSALRAFRGTVGRKDAKRVIRRLRKVSPKLGAARDWDVLLARLEAGAAPPEVVRMARAKQAAARRAARRAMMSKSIAAVPAEVRALPLADAGATLAQFGAQALGRAREKLMRQARGVDWADAAERHAIRIRVKRLRYSCEFFAAAFPARRAAGTLAALKQLQELLGELNDISVGRRLIGFEADEAALIKRLRAAWARFARQAPFWPPPA
jgi:triphosphatase